eukprot:6325633-Pyramimonas_sp.AAC.1
MPLEAGVNSKLPRPSPVPLAGSGVGAATGWPSAFSSGPSLPASIVGGITAGRKLGFQPVPV